jgi:hypothetical protein
MVGVPSPEESGLISARRARALQLRIAGVDNLTIGRQMAADPRIQANGVEYPAGYGRDRYERGDDPISDEDLVARVSEDISRALKIRQAQMNEGAEQLRTIQDGRIERLIATVFKKAIEGDPKSIDQMLKLLERQSRLHGLDSPVRTELVDKDGESIQLVQVERKREAAIEFLDTLADGEERAIKAARALAEREDAGAS